MGRSFGSVLATAAGVLVVACGDGTAVAPPPPPPPAPVATVTIAPTGATVVPVQTIQLAATLKDAAGNPLSGRSVTWSSGATAVATVDGNGLVTGATAGTAEITASSEGKAGTATIMVRDGGLVGSAGGTVTAAGGNVSLSVPAQALLAATAITVTPVANPQPDPKLVPGTAYEFGPAGVTFAQPVTIKIKYPGTLPAGLVAAQFRLHKLVGTTWTLVTGSVVNETNATVSGETSSFSIYAVLEVAAPVVVVTMSATVATVSVGQTLQLTATPKDALGNALTGRTITWTSTAGTVATVSSSGLVTTAALGQTTVKATSEGVEGQTAITVIPATIPSERTLAVGARHACGLDPAGKAYCWGENGFGELGDGTRIDRTQPTPVNTTARFVAITVGGAISCGLSQAGAVFCWGRNTLTGDGSSDDRLLPVTVGLPSGAVAVEASENLVCAISRDGGTYCWGTEIGSSSVFVVSSSRPLRIQPDPTYRSLTMSGEIFGPGTENVSGRFCGLDGAGAVWCWGRASGVGDPTFGLTPKRFPTDLRFTRLSAGYAGVCGITSSDQLWCWGARTGDGTAIFRTDPVLVDAPNTYRQVSVGLNFTCAVRTSGQVQCWGTNYRGQLGDGSYVEHLRPGPVTGLGAQVVVVQAGDDAACGLTQDGAVVCWGANKTSLFGDGALDYSRVPVQVANLANAHSVWAGELNPFFNDPFYSMCASNSSDQLYCWGDRRSAVPVPATAFGQVTWADVAIGRDYGCGVQGNHRAYCWGNNRLGQLGNGSTISSTAPVPVSLDVDVQRVVAGVCALGTSGILYCWGGLSGPINPPTAVAGGLRFRSIAKGDPGICGLTPVNEIYCSPSTDPASQAFTLLPGGAQWGDLGGDCRVTLAGAVACASTGNGTNFTALPQMIFVSGSERAGCGLAAGGAAWCWGRNFDGGVGSGSTSDDFQQPSQVAGGHSFVKLSVGPFSSTNCGIDAAGTVWCWGTNERGRLGTGVLDESPNPVAAIGGVRFQVEEWPL